MIRENQQEVLNFIQPKNVLVSVFDKTGLEELVTGLISFNSQLKFYSTGGTGKKICGILGNKSESNYVSIERFTGAPEMEGGLVKTLHPKVHAGLLAERMNPAHEEYLYKILTRDDSMPGAYFDIFVGNLYPFVDVISKEECTPEIARVNIDIGGPTMTMAAAKNWPSVAVLTHPCDYTDFILSLKANNGISLQHRFNLAKKAFDVIGRYRTKIGEYFMSLDFEKDVKPTMNIAK